ncbi:hypothetical protein DUNSADRAFT_9189 [Dunaliella salina]|uniref:Encoded protein n=1 Tax=Dunaliella salina TaxID=3046 RepID=A0ABQ7GHZ7_DUNSA|nr:hypothetical protein DUNSADRAFT_9189 [Dunaliella salina]|eukprot:KAF5834236.1 hypothetical protein DUNSADRAFT_9189 [Dunaliella salina]
MSGVYVLQSLESDPVQCAKRNVRGCTLEQCKALAASWEAPPPMLPMLDVMPLMHGKFAGASHIDEVDMESDEEAAKPEKEAVSGGAGKGNRGQQGEAASEAARSEGG